MAYIGKPINFMKHIVVYFVISGLVLVPGIISLVVYGLKPAIDFTGGSMIELKFTNPQNVSEKKIRENTPSAIKIESIQHTNNDSYIIKTKPITKDQNISLQQGYSDKLGSVTELGFETLGPSLGKELLKKTIGALVLASVLILGYVGYRFRDTKFGVCAVIAALHDCLVVLGIYSILGHFGGIEVDTLFVTALLTILSFSVHDTIIVYDRVREAKRTFSRASLFDLSNKAVNETLGRSVNNSLTAIFMLLALWLLGGESTHWFVFALLIGVTTGTYSSTFTAIPLLVVWDQFKKNK